MKKRILILCTGNSCRSQMAHGFLQSFDAQYRLVRDEIRRAFHDFYLSIVHQES